MSRPGDPDRRFELLEGTSPAITAKAVELVGSIPGAHTFELAYDARDRHLEDDEEPGPTEAVRWTARATIKRRNGKHRYEHTYEGTAIADPVAQTPPGGHGQAAVLAVVELLEKLGANVILLEQLRNPQ